LATLEEALGQVILRHREEKGLSQMDLAVGTGYSLRYIGDIERGKKSATLRTMNDLATLLGLSLGKLILAAEELLISSRRGRKVPLANRASKGTLRRSRK
jgi:transcriptional regulator with XRE-family HTH domain